MPGCERKRLIVKDKVRGGWRRRCAAMEEAKQTAAWGSQEEAAARGEMLHARDVSCSDTRVAKRKRADTMEEAECTGRHQDLQYRAISNFRFSCVSAAKMSMAGVHSVRWMNPLTCWHSPYSTKSLIESGQDGGKCLGSIYDVDAEVPLTRN